MRKKDKKIKNFRKFSKIILLTYQNQVIEYSKIVIAMQGGQCLPFFVLFKGGDAYAISSYKFYWFSKNRMITIFVLLLYIKGQIVIHPLCQPTK